MTPTGIELHQASRELELIYANGERHRLSCELLRVLSPSAEVQGHGPGQKTLQTGKINVAITEIRPVGNYAIQLTFSDGHDSGIYSWNFLRDLIDNKDQYWEQYLNELHEAGASRDPEVQVVKFFEP